MNGEPLPFWFGVLVGMVAPTAFIIVGYLVGRGVARTWDYIERRMLVYRLANEGAALLQNERSKEGAR